MSDDTGILGIGEHDWFTPKFIGYPCCRKCGIVRRADDKNKPCRGKVVLSLRDEYTEAADPGTALAIVSALRACGMVDKKTAAAGAYLFHTALRFTGYRLVPVAE